MIKAYFSRQEGCNYTNRSLYKLSNIDNHFHEVIEILRSGNVSQDVLKYYLETVLMNSEKIVFDDIQIFFNLLKLYKDDKIIRCNLYKIITEISHNDPQELDDHYVIFQSLDNNIKCLLELYEYNYDCMHYMICIRNTVNLLIKLDPVICLDMYFNTDLFCSIINNSIQQDYLDFELINQILILSPSIYIDNMMYVIRHTYIIKYLVNSLSITSDVNTICKIFILLKNITNIVYDSYDKNELYELKNVLDVYSGIDVILIAKSKVDLQPVSNNEIDEAFMRIIKIYTIVTKDIESIKKFSDFFNNLLYELNYDDLSVNMNIALCITSHEELSNYVNINIENLTNHIQCMTPNVFRDFCCYLHNKMLEDDMTNQSIVDMMNNPKIANKVLTTINRRLNCIFISNTELFDLTESIYDLSFSTKNILDVISIKTLQNALCFKYTDDDPFSSSFLYLIKILWNISEIPEMRIEMISNNITSLLEKKLELYQDKEFIEWCSNLLCRLKNQM